MFESPWMSTTSFVTEPNCGREKGTEMLITHMIYLEATEALVDCLTCIGSLLCAALGRLAHPGQDHVKDGGHLGRKREFFKVCFKCCSFQAVWTHLMLLLTALDGGSVVLWTEILHPLLYWDFFLLLFLSQLSLEFVLSTVWIHPVPNVSFGFL